MKYSSEKVINGEIGVNNCGIQPIKEFDSKINRKRIDYTLLYISEGQATVYIDGKTHTAKKGEAIFFPPNAEQDYVFYGKDNNLLKWIHFSGKLCQKLDDYPRILPIVHRHEFDSNLDRLCNAFYNITSDDDFLCDGYIRVILALFIESFRQSQAKSRGQKGKIPAVLDYMSYSIGEKIDFDYCAKMCYVSRNRFNHLFKEYTGKSPNDYLLNLKIKRAKQLLYDLGMSSTECAETLGFCDSNYFRRIFKKYTGLTPKQFLNQAKSEY